MKKFSIIIPHKNIPTLLRRCINSIPKRNDIEIIVVDDNSDLLTLSHNDFLEINKLSVNIILTKENKGAGYARNVGLKYAQGKWILFADSDDFYNSNFNDFLDNYIESDFEIIYFSADSVDSDTLLPSNRDVYLKHNFKYLNESITNSVENIKYTYWVPWNKMFNHAFIIENKLQFEEVIVGNDAIFVLKAGAYSNRIKIDNRAIYCVTRRMDSITFSRHDNWFDCRFYNTFMINNFFSIINRNKYRVSTLAIILLTLKHRKFNKALYYIKYSIQHREYFCIISLNSLRELLVTIKHKFL